MNPTACIVEAVGSFGFGSLYGNYTSDHFMYNPESGEIEMHGEKGEKTYEEKYDILTSCPLGVDESGKAFTPIDGDFCGLRPPPICQQLSGPRPRGGEGEGWQQQQQQQ